MENKVLAVVAGVEITQNDLEEVIMRYPEDKRGYFNNEQGKKQLLEQIIAFELFNKFGLESNIDKTEEYKKEIEKVEKDILTQILKGLRYQILFKNIMNKIRLNLKSQKLYQLSTY